jgi:hypothetical protein
MVALDMCNRYAGHFGYQEAENSFIMIDELR